MCLCIPFYEDKYINVLCIYMFHYYIKNPYFDALLLFDTNSV